MTLSSNCARMRTGDAAAEFDPEWRRFFGLGNATGLGLVPFFVHHPRLVHAWVGVRELALAEVRSMPPTEAGRSRLRATLDRARAHFATGTDDDCKPFRNPQQLVPILDRLVRAWSDVADRNDAYDAFFRAVEHDEPEAVELAVTALVELHEADDTDIDNLLRVDESGPIDHTLELPAFGQLLDQRFPWLDELALDTDTADTFWWVISDNTDEPRRTRRGALSPAGRDVAIDIALRVHRLRTELATTTASTVAELLERHPEHRAAVARVFMSDRVYGEARDNVCDETYLPLQLQRFQLAMYGMDNYKPKSTDWLRVTLFQGAPRADELATVDVDAWTFPARPGASA